MFVWRLSKYADLSGRGGLAASGRWHTRPRSVIYCADEAHTAYREILRHVGIPELIPDDSKLLKIEIPSSVTVEEVDATALPPLWSDNTGGWQICRPIGDAWIASGRSAVLKVPSAAHLGSCNFLINPAVREADDITIVETISKPFPTFATRGR